MDDLSELIGRTRLARAPIASASPLTAIPEPPSIGAIAASADAPAPPAIDAAPYPATVEPAVTDEERVLLYVLRLVDRASDLQPLSPVERAFVEGARVTFDRLAKACKALLDRKGLTSLAPIADPRQTATAAMPKEDASGLLADAAPSRSRGLTKSTKTSNA